MSKMFENLLTKGISSLIVLVIAVGLFLFWAMMIIDCLKRSFKKPVYKILWFFLIVVLQAIGAFIYWLAVYKRS